MKEKIFLAPVIAGAVAVALTFSGCTKAKPAAKQYSEQHADTLVAQGDPVGAADEYARMGELLLMPEGFQYADKLFDQALQQDPTNAKALLYKSVTEPMMALKGYIARVEPLITSDYDQKSLEKLRQNLKGLNMPELEDYSENLATGQQPFQSYYDVQRFVRTQFLPTILNSVDRLNKVDASKPIQMNFTPARTLIDPIRKSLSYSSSYNSCSMINNQWTCYDYNYNYDTEDKKLPNLYFIDQHDLSIMKSAMMGVADSIRVATAYSMQDSEFAMRRLKALGEIRNDDGQKLTAQDVVTLLNGYGHLFTLESDNQLGAIAASTSQALKYGIELANLKSTLCDNPSARTKLNSLFTPICIEADVVSSLKMGVDLLAGPKVVNIGNDSNGNPISAVLDVTAILKKPPQDLKAFFPNQFDAQGNPSNYPDPTMGGLFPNGDVISQLELVGPSTAIKKAVRLVNKTVNDVGSHI